MSRKVTVLLMPGGEIIANSSIHVSPPAALKRYVERCVEAGEYASPSDCIRALIRKDRERQSKVSALRAELQSGVDQLDRDEGRPAHEVFSGLRARGKAPSG